MHKVRPSQTASLSAHPPSTRRSLIPPAPTRPQPSVRSFESIARTNNDLPWDRADDVRDGAVRVDRRKPFAVAKLTVLALRREDRAVRVRDAEPHGECGGRGRGAGDARGVRPAFEPSAGRPP